MRPCLTRVCRCVRLVDVCYARRWYSRYVTTVLQIVIYGLTTDTCASSLGHPRSDSTYVSPTVCNQLRPRQPKSSPFDSMCRILRFYSQSSATNLMHILPTSFSIAFLCLSMGFQPPTRASHVYYATSTCSSLEEGCLLLTSLARSCLHFPQHSDKSETPLSHVRSSHKLAPVIPPALRRDPWEPCTGWCNWGIHTKNPEHR